MNELVTIRPYEEKDREILKQEAEKDKHSGVYCPTHVTIKEGQIVGYVSIGVVPMILTWQHSEKVGPLDSMRILGHIEGAVAQAGFKSHCFPCDTESPYNRLLSKAGYIEYTKLVKLYIKI
jgi:hypothetical protein